MPLALKTSPIATLANGVLEEVVSRREQCAELGQLAEFDADEATEHAASEAVSAATAWRHDLLELASDGSVDFDADHDGEDLFKRVQKAIETAVVAQVKAKIEADPRFVEADAPTV